MDELEFVKLLEEDKNLFNQNFINLNSFYNLKNREKLFNYIENHKGIIVLLNKMKPCLNETFPNARFDLVFYTDPEVKKLSHVILYVKVDEYTFDNGVMEDIDKIDFQFIRLMQKLDIMGNFSILPALSIL